MQRQQEMRALHRRWRRAGPSTRLCWTSLASIWDSELDCAPSPSSGYGCQLDGCTGERVGFLLTVKGHLRTAVPRALKVIHPCTVITSGLSAARVPVLQIGTSREDYHFHNTFCRYPLRRQQRGISSLHRCVPTTPSRPELLEHAGARPAIVGGGHPLASIVSIGSVGCSAQPPAAAPARGLFRVKSVAWALRAVLLQLR